MYSPQIPACAHPKTHMSKTKLPQTHMIPKSKELKEITRLTMFHKRSVQDILYEWTPRSSPPPTSRPSITSYCFVGDYLVMISGGAVKTARTGSSGNWLGSPTFSESWGRISDRWHYSTRWKHGSGPRWFNRDRWTPQSEDCLQAAVLVVSKVQTGNQLVSECKYRWVLSVGTVRLFRPQDTFLSIL